VTKAATDCSPAPCKSWQLELGSRVMFDVLYGRMMVKVGLILMGLQGRTPGTWLMVWQVQDHGLWAIVTCSLISPAAQVLTPMGESQHL